MTFDEWVETQPLFTNKGLKIAKAAWDAATLAEREACANTCEALPADDPTGPWFNNDMTMAAIDCANAIRKRQWPLTPEISGTECPLN